MKPAPSKSSPIRIAVFASITGSRRTPATPVERALRERRRLERARPLPLPAARPARGVS